MSFLLEEIREKDTRINRECSTSTYCCTFVRSSLLTHPELLSRINSRHQGLTRHLRNLLSNPISGTTTPTFQLPLPAGSELPTSHLSNKDAQAVIKIQGEWGKIEVLQEEKIKLAERMERIVNRARERGKAEWRKVGGMDPDEIEAAENKVLLGDMGSAEVVLPPTGLGTGSDRPFKSKLTLASSLRCTDSPAGLMEYLADCCRTKAQRPSSAPPIFHPTHRPPPIVHATSTRSRPDSSSQPSETRAPTQRIDNLRAGRRWRGRDGSCRSGRYRGGRHAVLSVSAEELRRDDRLRQRQVRVRMGKWIFPFAPPSSSPLSVGKTRTTSTFASANATVECACGSGYVKISADRAPSFTSNASISVEHFRTPGTVQTASRSSATFRATAGWRVARTRRAGSDESGDRVLTLLHGLAVVCVTMYLFYAAWVLGKQGITMVVQFQDALVAQMTSAPARCDSPT